MNKKYHRIIVLSLMCFAALSFIKKDKPTLYLIGDSTVVRWGKFLIQYFDTTKINIVNRAVGGTSSRTYYTQGVWDKALAENGMWDSIKQTLKPGDFVLIQFGHNDDAALSDTARSRGTIKGIGDDSAIVFNRFLNRNETVHTFGWYMSRYITETQAHGAVAVVCSPVPKNKWTNGKVMRVNNTYGKWDDEVVQKLHAFFIDLNALIADKYDAEGEAVTTAYFSPDNVHTVDAGSVMNASVVASGIKNLERCRLRKFEKK